MESSRVLVIDDVPDVLATVTGILVDEGYQVSRASSRDEALSLLSGEHFDVVVLDVRLDESDEGNRDGLTLMYEISEWYSSTAVIILTGYADIPMVREALQPDSRGRAPAFAFLEKTEFDQLPSTVARAQQSIIERSANELSRMLEDGESDRVEFKSSLRWDYRTNTVNKALTDAVVEAIAGMLNCKGGTLLIGVSDDGALLGIELDLGTLRKNSTDGFQLLLSNRLQESIGVEGIPHIHIRFETVDNKTVCVVDVPPSRNPVFLANGGKFYVRMNNSTRSLGPRDTISYVRSHWGNV